jgi:hypothetical protein
MPVEDRVRLFVLGRHALVKVVALLHRVELGERDDVAGHQLLRAGEHGNRKSVRGLA